MPVRGGLFFVKEKKKLWLKNLKVKTEDIVGLLNLFPTKLSKNKSRPESLREFPKKNQAVTLTRNNFTIRHTMQLSGKIAKQLKYA